MKLIGFRKLKSVCENQSCVGCLHEEATQRISKGKFHYEGICSAKLCPIWNKLKTAKCGYCGEKVRS